MLKEGREYLFTAERETETPDGKKHWVLRGPDNKKYLIPSLYYTHHGILPRCRLTCRVDKINCRGETFLEPRHPFYREGKKYEFEVLSVRFQTGYSGNEEKVLIVKDIFGNEIPAPFPEKVTNNPSPGSKVLLKVEKIYKGKPVLLKTGKVQGLFKGLLYGNTYEFTAEKIATGPDGTAQIVARDPAGRVHLIPYRYYSHYNIQPGKSFSGRIIKHTRKGEWKIEPENPFYKKNQTITLNITSVRENTQKKTWILSLTDDFGFVHNIESSSIPKENIVKCQVIKIRKGQPLLALM